MTPHQAPSGLNVAAALAALNAALGGDGNGGAPGLSACPPVGTGWVVSTTQIGVESTEAAADGAGTEVGGNCEQVAGRGQAGAVSVRDPVAGMSTQGVGRRTWLAGIPAS